MTKTKTFHRNQKSLIDSVGYFIMYLMVGAIPHIYKYMVFAPAESESIYFKEMMYADLYMLAKSRVFLVLTVVLLCVFIYQLTNKHIIFIRDKITIGTGIFAGFVILSSVMSEYQDIVYWGAKDRFEGMWIWLAYLVVFTVMRHYSSNKRFVDILLKVFVFSASLMALIGVMQIFGYDIYTEGMLRWLIFPNEIASNIEKYMISNLTESQAVGALLNSNYYGVYCGLATLAGLTLVFKSTKLYRWIYFFVIIITYGAMIASGSEAALLGFGVGLFALLLVSGSEYYNNRILALSILFALIVVDRVVVNMLVGYQTDNAKYIYLLMILMSIVGMFLSVIIAKNKQFVEWIKKKSLILSSTIIILCVVIFHLAFSVFPSTMTNHAISELLIEGNKLNLKLVGDERLQMDFLVSGVNTYGEDKRLIQAKPLNDDTIEIRTISKKYKIEFTSYSNGYLVTFQSPVELNFFYNGSSVEYVDSITGIGKLQYPKRFEYYYKRGSAFSNRGYIWGTFLPILQENLILGNGLDTYIITFPQSDVVGKNSFFTGGERQIIIDKPHSMYIMVGLSLGGVGFCIVLLFIVIVLKRYLMCIDTANEKTSGLILLIMLFVVGIFNDSVIPISLLLFCFGGFSIGCIDTN